MESTRFWGSIVFYAPLPCFLLSLINACAGLLVVNVYSTTCVENLEGFVKSFIGMGYLLMMAYTYLLIGPMPIFDIRVYQFAGALWCFLCIIL